MIFEFHETDLEEGLPRVLPYPLSSAAIYLRPDQMSDEIIQLLDMEKNEIDAGGRWFIRVWDERVPNDPVGEAVFCMKSGVIEEEALWVMAPYGPMNIAGYLRDIGKRLWASSTE